LVGGDTKVQVIKKFDEFEIKTGEEIGPIARKVHELILKDFMEDDFDVIDIND
jgi:hypothetical protein